MRRPARLQRRLMIAVAGFVLFTSALFGLYAMAFMYSVEGRRSWHRKPVSCRRRTR